MRRRAIIRSVAEIKRRGDPALPAVFGDEVSADGGYYSAQAVDGLYALGVDPFVARTRPATEVSSRQCPGGAYQATCHLEVWPESHWPGFALGQPDVFQSYAAW